MASATQAPYGMPAVSPPAITSGFDGRSASAMRAVSSRRSAVNEMIFRQST